MPDSGSAQSPCVASSSKILNNRLNDESGKTQGHQLNRGLQIDTQVLMAKD
jgi:hypothetical protein